MWCVVVCLDGLLLEKPGVPGRKGADACAVAFSERSKGELRLVKVGHGRGKSDRRRADRFVALPSAIGGVGVVIKAQCVRGRTARCVRLAL